MNVFNGCKVFCATIIAHRQVLGEEVTRWLEEKRQHPGFKIVDIVVRQSSDNDHHCTSIVILFNEGKV